MAAAVLAVADNKEWLYRPDFADDWKRRPLYSLAQWVNGLAFRDIQFTPSGMPVIKIAEIKGGVSGQTKFTQQTFDESVRVRDGDLLFSWSGQPETSIDAFWWRGPEGWLNQHVFRVTPANGVDPTFFYYLLRYLKPNFIAIARNKQTTGLGHVTKRDLEKIQAAYPEIPEQRAIAHILGTLDDKIELNRRMSETLEAMARALFTSWFVDFDPVRAKVEGRDPGVPPSIAELFPNSIETFEDREVPAGWRIGIVEDLCSAIFSGGTPATRRADYWNGGIPWLSSGETRSAVIIGTEKSITSQGVENSSTRFAPRGSTVIASAGQGSTRGQTSLLMIDSYVNQSVVVCRANQTISSDIHLYLELSRRYDEFRRVSDGHSSRGSLTTKLVASLSAVIPPPNVVRAFDLRVRPIVSRIVSALQESNSLAVLRDALLPKLISGELRVREAERFLASAN